MINKSLYLGFASAAALMGASPALALTDAAGFTAGISAGSLGVGPEVGFRPSALVGVRASASFLDVSHNFDLDDINYDGKVKLESYGAMLDLYPFKGGFRVSGGFRINKNRVGVVATPTTSVTVGSVLYTPAQIGTLSGAVTTDEFAPVVTVGYAGGLTKGLKFGIDAGVLFQGKPKMDKLTSTGTFSTNATYLAEVEKERIKFNDDIDEFQFYPALQLSLFYAF